MSTPAPSDRPLNSSDRVPPRHTPPGVSLFPRTLGHYRLEEPLGKGGMGLVFKAVHLHLKRPVALKLLPPINTRQPALVARFFQEMAAIGRLDHPNLVHATDAGTVDGYYYLAMELLDGLDLSRLSALLGPLTTPDACELIRQAALGLHCLHTAGLTHRDVKPSNLFLTAEGCVKVLDLGLAHFRETAAGDERLTSPGMVLGTGDYMAPEQGQDSRDADHRADVYALGCTLYKLLAGRPPFAEPSYDTLFKKMQAHATAPMPPLTHFRPDVPPELCAVLVQMVAKAPGDRPASAANLAEALLPFTTGADLRGLLDRARREAATRVEEPRLESPTAQSETLVQRGNRPAAGSPFEAQGLPATTLWRKKNWWWAATIGLAVFGVILGAVLFFQFMGKEEKPPKGWQDLLKNPPAKLMWPEGSTEARFFHNPAQQELVVQMPEECLLELGSTDAASFRLQLGLFQSRWHGGLGIFLGYREVQEEGGKSIHYQQLLLQRYLPNDPKKAFKLIRRNVVIPPPGEKGGTQSVDVVSEILPQPDNNECVLDVTVANHEMTSVAWAGIPLPKLVEKRFNRPFGAADYQGRFGVCAAAGDGTFRNFRFKRQEQE